MRTGTYPTTHPTVSFGRSTSRRRTGGAATAPHYCGTQKTHSLRADGETIIVLTQDTAHVTTSIRDTGVGMTAEHLRRVTSSFQSSKRDGNGLGLKIARRIVQTHGGSLNMESEPGEGTCVTVELPRSERRVTGLPRDPA